MSAQVVRWSADGEWILYGAPEYPTDAVNAELFALPVAGGAPQPVFDAAPWGLRDQYISCGNTIVFSAGSGGALGEPDFGKEANELYTASPPTWDTAELPAVISDLDELESEFWPDCSPDGTHVAVTGKRGSYSTILYFPLSGEGSTGAFDTGDGVAEYPLWSKNHSPEQPVILHVRRNGQAAELYLFDGDYRPIASLGNLHPLERSYETMLDWYQP